VRIVQVIADTSQPIWDEHFALDVDHRSRRFLRIKVIDRDTFGSNELLGECVVPLKVSCDHEKMSLTA
jgi:Ca2+-dependent lipid-binding protein